MYELKIIRNYASALFDISVNSSVEEKVLIQIITVHKIFSGDKKLNNVMCSPIVHHFHKNKILAALTETIALEASFLRFLTLLIRKARFNLLGPITEAYSLMLAESSGIKYAEVLTASILGQEDVIKIQKYLEQLLKKTIVIKSTIDRDLIGGMIIKYDSNLIDCSVSGVLERVEKIAKETRI